MMTLNYQMSSSRPKAYKPPDAMFFLQAPSILTFILCHLYTLIYYDAIETFIIFFIILQFVYYLFFF